MKIILTLNTSLSTINSRFTDTCSIGWFSNRTGTSFDDGKAHRKDLTWLPVPNLPLCHWSSQLFHLRAPSSTDVPVLLLNQPNMHTSLSWTVCFVPGERNPFDFLLIQPTYLGHLVNMDTFFDPLSLHINEVWLYFWNLGCFMWLRLCFVFIVGSML